MMQERFSGHASKVGEVHVVQLRGELDMATARGLSEWLVDTADSPVVVDLSELTFIDSSGLAELAIAKERMTAEGNELTLARPRTIVERVIEITGMVDLLSDQVGCHLSFRRHRESDAWSVRTETIPRTATRENRGAHYAHWRRSGP